MKAYRYEFLSDSWHWSASVNEMIAYIPNFNVLLYMNKDGTTGINSEPEHLLRAKEYVDEVLSGSIKECEDVQTNDSFRKTHIKRVDKKVIEKTTFEAYKIYNFQEIDIEFTQDGLDDLLSDYELLKKEKETYELSREVFDNNIKHLIKQ